MLSFFLLIQNWIIFHNFIKNCIYQWPQIHKNTRLKSQIRILYEKNDLINEWKAQIQNHWIWIQIQIISNECETKKKKSNLDYNYPEKRMINRIINPKPSERNDFNRQYKYRIVGF